MVYKRDEYDRAKITYHFITMRIPHEQYKRIVSFAKDHKVSEAEACRTLIEWGLIEDAADPRED